MGWAAVTACSSEAHNHLTVWVTLQQMKPLVLNLQVAPRPLLTFPLQQDTHSVLFRGVQITLVPTVLKPLLRCKESYHATPLRQGLGEEKGLLMQLCFLCVFSFSWLVWVFLASSLLHLPTIQIHRSIPEMEPL